MPIGVFHNFVNESLEVGGVGNKTKYAHLMLLGLGPDRFERYPRPGKFKLRIIEEAILKVF